MNGKKARLIRKSVYGDMVSGLKGRHYQVMSNGEIRADPLRQSYQWLKKQRRMAV